MVQNSFSPYPCIGYSSPPRSIQGFGHANGFARCVLVWQLEELDIHSLGQLCHLCFCINSLFWVLWTALSIIGILDSLAQSSLVLCTVETVFNLCVIDVGTTGWSPSLGNRNWVLLTNSGWVVYIVLAGTPLQPLLSWHPIIQDVYNVSTMPFLYMRYKAWARCMLFGVRRHSQWRSGLRPRLRWAPSFVCLCLICCNNPVIPYVLYHTAKYIFFCVSTWRNITISNTYGLIKWHLIKWPNVFYLLQITNPKL